MRDERWDQEQRARRDEFYPLEEHTSSPAFESSRPEVGSDGGAAKAQKGALHAPRRHVTRLKYPKYEAFPEIDLLHPHPVLLLPGSDKFCRCTFFDTTPTCL